jgi:hypothetical protein
MPGAPSSAQYARPVGPLGHPRPTGVTILLVLVTFGIWGIVWWYQVHFISSYEVAGLYQRSGRPSPVSALTGLWYFPGMFILVGPFIWFVQTNNALNEYWVSLGADPTPRL